MPKRILFVDDDALMLESLRAAMRRHRDRYQMVFAEGPRPALEELERATFDVIVTDLGMPGMDGADLLREVMRRHPGIARIVLSGDATQAALLRTLPLTHQLLAKPCTPTELQTAVERACGVGSILQDAALRRVVAGVHRLPPSPKVYFELSAALARQAGASEIAAVVEKDPALAAKVLQLAGSAFFGLAQRPASVQQAVVVLGTELVRGLALSAHVFEAVPVPPEAGISLERFQELSLRAARLSRRALRGSRRADDAFTAALVHDVGRLVLALARPDACGLILATALEQKRPLHVVEREVLGVSHAEVGAHLLSMWGLPFEVVETAAFHHAPMAAPEGARELLGAVHVAAAIASGDEIDASFVAACRLEERIQELCAEAA